MPAEPGLDRVFAPYTFEQPLAVDRRDNGTLIALWLDADGQRLTELAWLPGREIAAWETLPDEPLQRLPHLASLTGDYVLLAGTSSRKAIRRPSGDVVAMAFSLDPAAFSSGDSAVISVDRHNLVSQQVVRSEGGRLTLHAASPLAACEIDSPRSVAVIPKKSPAHYHVVAGGYGSLVHVTVDWQTPEVPQATAVSASTGRLPYDRVYIEGPVPLESAPGAYVYATEWGRAALIALDLTTTEVEDCPLESRDYNSVIEVVPRLDGGACLVVDRLGALWRWEPGRRFEAIELPGFPLLWHEERALVFSDGKVREIALP
mgnify:CR=1 FL=1